MCSRATSLEISSLGLNSFWSVLKVGSFWHEIEVMGIIWNLQLSRLGDLGSFSFFLL